MDLGLKGRFAAISGGSQGIGNQIARSLADEGCNVSISARGEERLQQAVQDLESRGVKAIGVQCDLSTEDGCKKFIDDTVAAFGELDILVNNVGGMTPGTLDSLSEEQWAEIMNRNLMSYIWCTKHAAPHLKKSEQGRVLNVTGMSGKQLMPGSISTTIPNTAIAGFAKLMAADLAPDAVTVNNICPGMVNTEGWGPRSEVMAKVRGITADEFRKGMAANALLNRWAEPEEIGDAAAFLVSKRNSFMTGTTVEVCGGWSKYI